MRIKGRRHLFIGDVHGKIDDYWKILQKFPHHTSLQVGDFGFKKHHQWHLDNIKSDQHKVLFGNHDDHSYCYKPHSVGDFSAMHGIMTIRGADSIDKHLRIEGRDWWREEELKYSVWLSIIDKVAEYKPNIIISHDCPQSMRERFFGITDRSTTSDGLEEVLKIHRPTYWIFGHHHRHIDEVVDGTRFICLGELDTFEMKSCTKCERVQPIDQFSPRSNRPGWGISQCKECKREYTAKRKQELPHLARQSDKNFKIKNREKVLAEGRERERRRMADQGKYEKKRAYNAEYARTHKRKAYISVGDKVYYQGLGYTIVGSVCGKGMLIRRLYGQPIMAPKRLLSKHANNT